LASKIRFQLATGSAYFMEIAKVRAARLLWARLLTAYQLESEKIAPAIIHATSSSWNKSLYNANANMLRTTTEAMAAAIGGVDSFTVVPYNMVYEEANDFTERLARNQQIILKEEAYMDKVADPSAGSYYIENLTNNIAQQAWELFLQVHNQGGFTAAFKKGFITGSIKESAANKDKAIANRRMVFVGTNQYPNTGEQLPDKEARNPFAGIRPSENPLAEPLKPYRGAMAFEELRQKTDKYALQNKRPVVFLLTYGNLNTRRARAQFSANFFACAGFDIIDNNGFDTIEQGVKEALEKQADIVVLCSVDDMYPEIAPKAHELMANKAIIVVAGYPKDSVESLQEKGIKHFVHVRSNALETLVSFQEMLGMA
jgi:methylmalonyl-CoA mutase